MFYATDLKKIFNTYIVDNELLHIILEEWQVNEKKTSDREKYMTRKVSSEKKNYKCR